MFKQQESLWQTLQQQINKFNNPQINQKSIDSSDSESEAEYNPYKLDKSLICQHCDIEMKNQGIHLSCDNCGLITSNKNYQSAQNFKTANFQIKTCEERQQELLIKYTIISADANRFLTELGLEQELIEEILIQSISQLKKLDKTSSVLMNKLYGCILFEVTNSMKLNISKQQIYEAFQIQNIKHCQSIKKIQQINTKYMQQPKQNQLFITDVLDVSSLYQVLYLKCKPYSSCANIAVFNIILEFMDLNQKCQYLKNTTNSVVIEYHQIANLWICSFEKWKQLISNGELPRQLTGMRSKNFNIDFTQSPPFFGKVNSDQKVMNTAVNLDFKSNSGSKTYTVKLFAKGKAVIGGLTSPYEQSEVNIFISKIFVAMFALADIPYQPPNIVKTTLCNFSTVIQLNQEDSSKFLIDIVQTFQYLQSKLHDIQQLCLKNNTNLVDVKNINHRLYITLAIEKQEMPFLVKNQCSTSNLKSSRSVVFILTQKGVLSIQGADDNLINTIHVKKVLLLIFDIYIRPFVYDKTHQEINESIILSNESELQAILTGLKSMNMTEQQKDLIVSIQSFFYPKHILAEHSIRIKIRYYQLIIKILNLIALNEEDDHCIQHLFTPLSYLLDPVKKPKTGDIKKPIGKLDICYRCLMVARRQCVIQPIEMNELLINVIKVPGLKNDVILLINQILSVMQKKF